MATKKVTQKAAKKTASAPAKSTAKAKAPQSSLKKGRLPGPMIERAAKKSARRTIAEPVEPRRAPKPIKVGRRPLDGIRVLDLSRLLPGPYASAILANFGAEVIKIERPREGDYARESHPQINGVGAVFETINRGKKSVAINLKHAKGKEAFLALARKTDIVIDGFRPGVMDGLGLGYKKLHRLNPKLIYAALTGYGQEGPYSQLAGHDLNYISLGGMLDLIGSTEGMPSLPGAQIADVAAGSLPTVIGILLALHSRKSTGKGQMIDIAMLDGVLGLLPGQVANYTTTKRKPRRGNERLFGQYACYNIYPARNGRYLAVGALEPKFWKALCTAVGRDDLVDDQYADGDRQQVLMAELTRVFQKKEVAEWMEIFEGQDVCVTEVRDISHAVQDEQIRQRHMIIPTKTKDGGVYEQLGVFPKLSDTPGVVSGDAPSRGEHTKEVLRSVGYTVKSVDNLMKRKIAEGADSE